SVTLASGLSPVPEGRISFVTGRTSGNSLSGTAVEVPSSQWMILGTSYRDSRGALVATDKVEKRDGSFFHVETGEELEQAPA
ncbi:hypothetical protein, partial [Streptococcus pyogenes]|uniref:hypothetical protein n=1 Tax=Streptococcus pyogenes TaxID=1314 RepID=UPI000FEFF20A